MRLSDFDFPFDPALVAERPADPRDHARLLTLDRRTGSRSHRRILDLPDLLDPGDLLVVNDTKVMPVRLSGRKRPGGGKVDLVLVKEIANNRWQALLKGAGRVGQIIDLAPDTSCRIVESGASATTIEVSSPRPFGKVLKEIGQVPLPPYIKRKPEQDDRQWYQTVFARHEGAIAAPTAGLHFSERVLAALHERGIGVASVTLHVGIGTFRPVKVECIEDHRMDTEWINMSQEAADAVTAAKAAGRKVVAVGTTVVRTLETVSLQEGGIRTYAGDTSLFITPGYRFQVVDALVTNFHLPRTTLLMLVSAFAGVERLKDAYEEAIKERYRLYSYGDAMLIV